MMDRSRFDADVLEWELPVSVVDALLVDHAVGKAWHNIRWCTKDYERYGIGFGENDEMRSMQIMDREHSIIQPRSLKAKEEQRRRSVERAEVFTPSWICNKQNNLVDAAWFHRKGKSSPFNREIDRKDGTHSWVTSRENIQFPHGLKWFDYVTANRLEVSCGEAPYLTSRYDTVTGKYIEPHDRIGLLDRDVFEDAGIQIRKLAKSAEKLPPGQRVQQIARIFSYFKNPDKETVLTPWRVVNMHMSDTLGGWCFFNDATTASSSSGSERGRAVSTKPPLAPFSDLLDEPRFVDRGDVTDRVFRSASKILEINSKSGLYPLYVAYSIYRRKCGEIPEQDIAAPAREKKWCETVKDNVFVICKTPMAASITRRTLVGYTSAAVNAIYVDNLIDTLKSAPAKFIKKITKGNFWKREEEEMKFDAVVGNPPYQEMKGDEKLGFASAIYPFFMNAAFGLSPRYVSMITPSRWLLKTGQGINEEWADKLIHSDHFITMCDYHDASDCFPGVEIKGGVLYFLYSADYRGKCHYRNCKRARLSEMHDHLDSFGCGVVVRDEIARSVLKKIFAVEGEHYPNDSFAKYVGPTHFFDKGGQLGSSWKGFELKKDAAHCIKYYLNKRVVDKGFAWIERRDIPKGHEAIGIHKVYVPEAYGAGEGFPHQILGVPFYGEPNSVCSQTYLCIGYDPSVRKFTKNECESIVSYIKTKLFRFLVLIKKNTQHSFSAVYQFVPVQDFSKPWDDEKLYKKYKLTREEIAFIESMIKPME